MDFKYSDVKKKKVVNVLDGKELGNITDVVFDFPEGDIKGFVCGKKMIFGCDEYYIKLQCINKIGDDAVLVSLKNKPDDAESSDD